MRSPTSARPSPRPALAVLASLVLLSACQTDEEQPVAPGDAPSAAASPETSSEPVGDACPTLRRLTATLDAEPAGDTDPETHHRRLTDMAELFDELAPQLRAYGSRRDVRRGDIFASAAHDLRDHAEALVRATHEGDAAISPEEHADLDDLLLWLSDMLFELLFWGAETCDDLPGVTRSEINGVPHTRIEIGPE